MRHWLRLFSCVFAGLLACSSASAEELRYYWDLEAPLYDFDAGLLSGSLCWNTYTGDAALYDYNRYDEQATTVNLYNGEVEKLSCPGYIIDKDDREYSGVLFAREQDDLLTIIHYNGAGNEETVYQSSAPQPVEYLGRQTIRAYMGGYLYYLKALEDNGTEDVVIYDTTTEEYLPIAHITYPKPVSAQLCRVGPDGDEYEYGLIGTYSTDRTPRYDQSLIDGYAIHPNGAVAWIDVDYDMETHLYLTRIWVETPQSAKRIVVDSAFVREMGYSMIAENGICWLSEHELLFFVETLSPWGDVYTLLQIDIESNEVVERRNSDGEAIQTEEPPIYGSGMILNPDQNELAYLTWSNWWNYTNGPTVFNWDVPMVIDLRTGESYYVYRNSEEWENRACRWRISWYESSE